LKNLEDTIQKDKLFSERQQELDLLKKAEKDFLKNHNWYWYFYRDMDLPELSPVEKDDLNFVLGVNGRLGKVLGIDIKSIDKKINYTYLTRDLPKEEIVKLSSWAWAIYINLRKKIFEQRTGVTL
jgi:hypothetical protein